MHKVFAVADDNIASPYQPIDPKRSIVSDDTQAPAVAFDLDGFTGFEHLIKHSIDILTQFRGGQ